MSQQEPKGIYIYQPYGTQDRWHWAEKRIYAIGGLVGATIRGITKEEAEAILKALNSLAEPPSQPATKERQE